MCINSIDCAEPFWPMRARPHTHPDHKPKQYNPPTIQIWTRKKIEAGQGKREYKNEKKWKKEVQKQSAGNVKIKRDWDQI